jgi:hypothetical protein
VKNRGGLKMGEIVEEGWAKIREVVLVGKGVDGNLTDIRLPVEVKCSA